MTHYILLDTCEWINLIESKKYVGLKSKLLDLEDRGKVKIVLPETVKDEWARHRIRLVESKVARLRTLRQHTMEYLNLLSDENISTTLDEISEETKNHYVNKDVDDIDTLFNSERVIPIGISPTIIATATDLAVKKKAPFQNKNSMADALILLSFLEYLSENKIQDAFFISSNKLDFAGKNKREIHPDLASLLEPNSVRYYLNIGEALQQIEPNLVSDEEVAEVEDFQNSLDLLESIYSSSLNSNLLAFSANKMFSDTILSSFGSESSIQQAVESIRALNVNIPDLSGVNTTNQLLAETIVSSFGSESSIQKALQNVRSLSLNVNLPDFSGLHARNKLLSDTLMSSFGSDSSLQKTLTEIQVSLGEGLANSAKRPHSKE